MKKIILLFLFCLTMVNFSNAQWQQTNGPEGGDIYCIASIGTTIFAGTRYHGVYVSTNNGASWTQVGLNGKSIFSLAVKGTTIFAGTGGQGIFFSNNNGISWTSANTGLTELYITSLAVNNSDVFAGTSDGLFLSTNNGSNWSAINTGLTNTNIKALCVSGTNIFASTNNGVFKSVNNGSSWTLAITGLTGLPAIFAVSGTDIFAGTNSGIFLSTNNGANWTSVNSGLGSKNIYCLAVNGSTIFASSIYTDTVYQSTNNGANWTIANIGLKNVDNIRSLHANGTTIFLGSVDRGVFRSTNNGASWTESNSGICHTYVTTLVTYGTNILAGTTRGLFLSTDDGMSWALKNVTNYRVNAIVVSGTNIFAGTDEGVYTSIDGGQNWTPCSLNSLIIYSMTVSGTNVYAGTYQNGVYLSTDNGLTWAPANTNISTISVYSLAVSGANILAGSTSGVYLSSNNGASWTVANSGLTNTDINVFLVNGTNVYVGTNGGGLFLSNNNGNSWGLVNTGFSNNYIYSMALEGANFYIGTGTDLYLSINNGNSWISTGFSKKAESIALNSNKIYAGTNRYGAWRSLLSNYVPLVWPGDANNDSIVDNNDLLPIGLYYGATGTARTGASNQWIAQSCSNWATFQYDSTNMNHADCSGDGTVNSPDTVAINLNYGQPVTAKKITMIHAKTTIPLAIVPASTSFNLNDTVIFNVVAGNASNPVSSMYGLSYDIHIDPTFIKPGTLNFSHVSSWLGNPNTNALVVSEIFESSGNIENAIIRTDHINQTGYGTIGKIKFVINPSITTIDTMPLSITYYNAVTVNGQAVSFNILDTAIIVSPVYTAINQSTLTYISISPNPANNYLYIDGLVNSATAELYDISGKLLLTKQLITNQIDISSLAKGLYFIKLTTEEGSVVRKFVKE